MDNENNKDIDKSEKIEKRVDDKKGVKIKVENKNTNGNTTAVLLVSIFWSFVCGMLGAYLISQTVSVESVVKTITTSELVENSISTSVDKVYNSTVFVIAYADGKQISTGTGFIYRKALKKAYIMTNNHVIEGATKIEITLTLNLMILVKE